MQISSAEYRNQWQLLRGNCFLKRVKEVMWIMHSFNMILAQRDLVQTKVRNIAGLEEDVIPDLGLRKPHTVIPGTYKTKHIPMFSDTKRNCKVCYYPV